ncbi:MAG: hypothetical protein ACRDV3_09255, partial [Acidothermaceae bacterium]
HSTKDGAERERNCSVVGMGLDQFKGYTGGMKLSHLPPRLATGAFIVNTGFTKLSADDDTAKGLHGMATNAYPFMRDIEPQTFVKGLAIGEIAVGSVLLAPFVPAWLAGLTLTGFSGGLVRLYLKTPGLTQEDGIRPTQKGTPIAKDFWMLGIGLGLFIDGLTPSRKKRRAMRRVARAPIRKAAALHR